MAINRKDFLIQCTGVCAGVALFSSLLESCATTFATASLDNNRLSVPLQSFQSAKGNGTFKRSIIVRHDKMPYPVLVSRTSENSYRALLLRCPHQGQELNVHGDLISCSAHGSEFNTHGEVIQGPAEHSLQLLPTSLDQHNLYIQML